MTTAEVFTNLETVSICLLDGQIRFGLLRLNMLQGWFEHSGVIFYNIIKTAKVESHKKLVCK